MSDQHHHRITLLDKFPTIVGGLAPVRNELLHEHGLKLEAARYLDGSLAVRIKLTTSAANEYARV